MEISRHPKTQTVARLFSHIPASAYPLSVKPREQAQACLSKVRKRAKAKIRVIVPSISPAPPVASLRLLIRFQGPRDLSG